MYYSRPGLSISLNVDAFFVVPWPPKFCPILMIMSSSLEANLISLLTFHRLNKPSSSLSHIPTDLFIHVHPSSIDATIYPAIFLVYFSHDMMIYTCAFTSTKSRSTPVPISTSISKNLYHCISISIYLYNYHLLYTSMSTHMNRGVLSNVMRLDAGGQQWQQVPAMPSARRLCSATACNGAAARFLHGTMRHGIYDATSKSVHDLSTCIYIYIFLLMLYLYLLFYWHFYMNIFVEIYVCECLHTCWGVHVHVQGNCCSIQHIYIYMGTGE